MRVEIIDSVLTKAIRHEVLWPHIVNKSECIIDIDQREDAIHLGVFDGDDLVGVCSLFEMKSPRLNYPKQYRLRAMATAASARGKGVGRLLVKKAVDVVGNKNMDVLWCDAREVALGFYEKLNFECIDEWYVVPNIGKHKTLFYEL